MTTEPRDETGGDPEALAVEAERALESGRAATAEALYSRALDMRPAEESWLMGRATARRFLARHEEALADVEAALAGNPGNLRLRLERGYALRAAGLNDAAETAYRSILADRPDQAEARVNLGMLLRAAHRTEEAVAVLQRAATRRPGDARVLTALGTARLEAGDVPGAARDLGQAMSANPWDRNALAHLYAAACAAGDIAAAEALFPAEDTLAVVDDVLGEDDAAPRSDRDVSFVRLAPHGALRFGQRADLRGLRSAPDDLIRSPRSPLQNSAGTTRGAMTSGNANSAMPMEASSRSTGSAVSETTGMMNF